jgi:phenylalanyl-tRNA synthetase beta chain
MKVPLEWLKEYVTLRLSPEAIAERLTMAGLEVTAIDRVGGDIVLNFEITPNRPDCLSVIGIAREVAAITGQRLKLPQRPASSNQQPATSNRQRVAGRRSPVAGAPHVPFPLTIRIEDRTSCERYIGRIIERVRVVPSPAWMQRRLLACGARPINNVVDITNYVLLEYGQPLHAFDFLRLADATVLVRRAHANESITTLDGVARTLPPETLVIADARQAVAVAGIMGGVGSEVTPQTTTILLESALFDPVTIRRGARRLGLATDSSYRFERGVDPVGVETASARALQLIEELSGGQEAAVCDVGSKPSKRVGVVIDSRRLQRWLGMPVAAPMIRTALAGFGCHVASSGPGGETMRVGIPSFRRDLTQDVDLFEEIARVIGYDRVPSTLPSLSVTAPQSEETARYGRTQSLRCLCASLGLTEAVTWSLLSEGDLSRFGFDPGRTARLANPLSQDHAYLRPSLLIGLLQAVRRNVSQGASGARLFEVGGVVDCSSGRVTEGCRLGVVLAGLWSRDWHRKEPSGFFLLKGLLETLVGRLCEGELQATPASLPWAEPGQGAQLHLNGRVFGTAGEISQSIRTAWDLEEPAWAAEFDVEQLLASRRRPIRAEAPPLFPPVKRDLSLVVDATTPFEVVDRLLRDTGSPLAHRVTLIDRYTGKQVPAGKVSLTFSIEYRDPSKTLTASDVDALHQRIVRALADRFGASLR